MSKLPPLVVFTGLLVIALSIAFVIHIFLIDHTEMTMSYEGLVAPYVANFILAGIITVLLYVLRVNQAHNLGFIFMGSSFVKFAVFFMVFYPVYKSDGDVSKIEFAQFFVPYAISLTVETLFLIKILNEMD